MTPTTTPPTFDRELHIRYFSHVLQQLPSPYASLDTSRLTLVHFCVQALCLLDAAPTLLNKKNRIIEWVYSLQTPPHDGGGGFMGGCSTPSHPYGHVAMTYTALCILHTLGDDLSRVHKTGIIQLLKQLQRPDGSFQCVAFGSEFDMRFLYCACAISYMLDDWSGVNVDLAIDFIQSCRAYDGAIALLSNQEGHGGSTFCAVASLKLMGRLDVIVNDKDWHSDLVYWCTHRQTCPQDEHHTGGGMQGRPNKLQDTCYSYWIGGTLNLLNKQHLLDQATLTDFVLRCQTKYGGFSKVLGVKPDVLHSFYSLSWLALSQTHPKDIKQLNCTLGMPQEVVNAMF